ncbi:hypothetical protein V1525DRAFT_342854 [Lipomyces kononenkoae]|uniref:Uncharacterized protein n=1 Tax=Lipomyces kononenkoae TaxID=34357 RepID=A0ACC3T1V1_LIPKO
MATSGESNLLQLRSSWVDSTRRSTRLIIKQSLQDVYWPEDPSPPRFSDIKKKSGSTINLCRSTGNGLTLPGCSGERPRSAPVSDPELILRRAKKARCDPVEATKHIAKLNVPNGANTDLNTRLVINMPETAVSQNLREDNVLTSVHGELGFTLIRNNTNQNLSCQWSQTPDRFVITQHEVALQIPAHAIPITSGAAEASTLKRYRQLETRPFGLVAGETAYASAYLDFGIGHTQYHPAPGIESDLFTIVGKRRNDISRLWTPQMVHQNRIPGDQVDAYSSEHKPKISEPILPVHDIPRATSRVVEPISQFHTTIPAPPNLGRTPSVEKACIPDPTAIIEFSAPLSNAPVQKITTSQTIASEIDKLDPIMQVPIWCDTHQELCESVPFFRSFQCGCYTYNGVAFGYILDELTARDDFISDNVIISQVGGQTFAVDSEKSELQISQGSAEQAVKALISNQKRATPLVLVLGSNCPLAPVNVPHRYCIMDWFVVTHSWENLDRSTGYKLWNFRFERINRNAKPWWHSPKNEIPELPLSAIETHRCSDCGISFPQVYKQGQMCLNSGCPQFWKVSGRDPADNLQYNEDFLALPSRHDQGLIPFDMCALPHARDALSVSGYHCGKCGKLNSREAWEGWMCSSPGCDEKLLILDRVDSYLSRRERDRLYATYTGTPISTDLVLDENVVSVSCHSVDFGSQGCYRVMKYEVIGVAGTIYHVIPNKTLCEFANGPDDILKEYKRVMSIFRRYPLQDTKSTSRTLSQYFAHNAGARYTLHGTTFPGTPFYLCPKAISMALNFIQDISRAEGVPHCEQFNEVLSLAYVESQRLGYHCDSDVDIGETVAGISLGSRAVMKFRKKDENVSRSGLHSILPAPAPSSVTGKSELQPILELDLGHGDVVIMQGADIHGRLVHSVDPTGEFRISATARYVREN